MRFVPNFKTKDGIFEVELDKSKLDYRIQEAGTYPKAKNITYNLVNVYNTMTGSYSTKSLYLSKDNRFYFKGSSSYWNKTPHSKYYIDELEEIKNGI